MGIKDKIKKIIKLTNEKNVVSIQMISDEGNILEGKVAVVLGATGGIGGGDSKKRI